MSHGRFAMSIRVQKFRMEPSSSKESQSKCRAEFTRSSSKVAALKGVSFGDCSPQARLKSQNQLTNCAERRKGGQLGAVLQRQHTESAEALQGSQAVKSDEGQAVQFQGLQDWQTLCQAAHTPIQQICMHANCLKIR